MAAAKVRESVGKAAPRNATARILPRARQACAWAAERELWLLAPAVPLLMFPGELAPLGLALVAALWLCRWISTGRLTTRTPLDLPVAALAAMALVGVYASVDLSLSVPKLYGIFLGVAVFYGLANGVRTERALWGVAGLLVAVGAAVSLVSLVGTDWDQKLLPLGEVYRRLPRFISNVPYAYRGGFHPNEVAGALALLLPLPFALLAFGARRTPRILVFPAFFLMALTLVLTQSRGAILGVVVAMLLVLVLRNWRFLLALPAGALGMGLAWQHLGAERWMGTLPSLEVTALGRQDVWQRALMLLQNYPFTGIGLGNFRRIGLVPTLAFNPYSADPNVAHGHNLFLQVGLDLGVPGLLAFAALIIILARSAWRAAGLWRGGELCALAVGLGAGLLAHLIYGLTDTVAPGSRPWPALWAMAALVLVMERLGQARESGAWEANSAPRLPQCWALAGLPKVRSRGKYALALPLAGLLALSIFKLPALASSFYANLGYLEWQKGTVVGADWDYKRQVLVVRRLNSQEEEHLQAAARLLSTAIQLDPRNAEAHRYLGLVHSQRGEFLRAAEMLERSVALEPANRAARLQLGNGYFHLGRREEAVAQWEQAGATAGYFLRSAGVPYSIVAAGPEGERAVREKLPMEKAAREKAELLQRAGKGG